ncbi:uncharacterized protein LOC135388714 [Ornithodoros turicata]|uniref:uncharacterized protein LOC135388714 n=1 Tax=Ornithodoros turicata TaxID=34597 RepID=UPI0031399C41
MGRAFLVTILMALIPEPGVHSVHYGMLLGDLEKVPPATDAVATGKVYAATDAIFLVADFVHDKVKGTATFALFKEGDKDPDVTKGDESNLEAKYNDVSTYSKGAVVAVLKLKSGKIADYKWLGLWDKKVVHVALKIPAATAPTALDLSAFKDSAGAAATKVTATKVTVVDSVSVTLAGFKYSESCAKAKVLVGSTTDKKPSATCKVENEKDGKEITAAAAAADLKLYLPPNRDWSEAKWISVYCVDAGKEGLLASVDLPDMKDMKFPVSNPISLATPTTTTTTSTTTKKPKTTTHKPHKKAASTARPSFCFVAMVALVTVIFGAKCSSVLLKGEREKNDWNGEA